ncbi:hypothetical protein KUTeg_006006 [Tegillarca granosa]|uniref:C1q domain-containing protein n=1 Tax=Tegillarca granosa TaxID=220873 RepID=A0ABQ9FHJ3_TEGGR|nr:hypothetical protein KUTeg_006006 [Tegillarca granosa]
MDDDHKLDDGHFHVLLLNVLHSLSSNLKKLISGTGPAGIGFTAIVVGGHVNVKRGSPIPFSKIINEYGYGFEIENGYFVCKKNGLYHFTASVCTVTGDVWVRIYKNNVEVGYLYKDQDSKWGSGTGSIVVRMMRGDKLHLSAEKNIRIADKVTIISGFCISC